MRARHYLTSWLSGRLKSTREQNMQPWMTINVSIRIYPLTFALHPCQKGRESYHSKNIAKDTFRSANWDPFRPVPTAVESIFQSRSTHTWWRHSISVRMVITTRCNWRALRSRRNGRLILDGSTQGSTAFRASSSDHLRGLVFARRAQIDQEWPWANLGTLGAERPRSKIAVQCLHNTVHSPAHARYRRIGRAPFFDWMDRPEFGVKFVCWAEWVNPVDCFDFWSDILIPDIYHSAQSYELNDPLLPITTPFETTTTKAYTTSTWSRSKRPSTPSLHHHYIERSYHVVWQLFTNMWLPTTSRLLTPASRLTFSFPTLCPLTVPLKHGAIAWNVFLAIYQLAGSIFLFRYGQFLYFNFPEWQIYGGIGMAVMAMAIISIIGLSNYSYMFTRLTFFLWPLILIVTSIRAGFMIFQLNRQQYKIIWQCNNGGQLWGQSAEAGYGTGTTMPSGICSAGFHSLYIAFVMSLIVDIIVQVYAYFLQWRFKSRMEHTYRQVQRKDAIYGP